MSIKQLIGLIGTVMLAVGSFAPMLHIPLRGSISYIHNGKGDGVIILIISVLAGYFTIKKDYISLRWSGILSLGILSYTFFNFQMKLREIQKGIDADLSSNPFKGLADIAVQNIYLEWGFAVILIGSVLLILDSFIKETQMQDRYQDKTDYEPPKTTKSDLPDLDIKMKNEEPEEDISYNLPINNEPIHHKMSEKRKKELKEKYNL